MVFFLPWLQTIPEGCARRPPLEGTSRVDILLAGDLAADHAVRPCSVSVNATIKRLPHGRPCLRDERRRPNNALVAAALLHTTTRLRFLNPLCGHADGSDGGHPGVMHRPVLPLDRRGALPMTEQLRIDMEGKAVGAGAAREIASTACCCDGRPWALALVWLLPLANGGVDRHLNSVGPTKRASSCSRPLGRWRISWRLDRRPGRALLPNTIVLVTEMILTAPDRAVHAGGLRLRALEFSGQEFAVCAGCCCN